jgi:hypothetical protein
MAKTSWRCHRSGGQTSPAEAEGAVGCGPRQARSHGHGQPAAASDNELESGAAVDLTAAGRTRILFFVRSFDRLSRSPAGRSLAAESVRRPTDYIKPRGSDVLVRPGSATPGDAAASAPALTPGLRPEAAPSNEKQIRAAATAAAPAPPSRGLGHRRSAAGPFEAAAAPGSRCITRDQRCPAPPVGGPSTRRRRRRAAATTSRHHWLSAVAAASREEHHDATNSAHRTTTGQRAGAVRGASVLRRRPSAAHGPALR